MKKVASFKPFLPGLGVGAAYVFGLGLAVALATPGCTPTKPAAASEPLDEEAAKALDEYKAEIEIGRNMAGRLLAHYGTNGDEKLLGYINQVGNYVASYGDYPERRYMFAILDSDTINAYACPGGYILITQGALKNAVNEAELAAILGHEVTHVGKRHMFDTLRNMEKKELEANAKAGENMDKFPPAMRVRARPKPEETGTGAMLARYLSGSAGAGLNILQAAQAGMNVILAKGLDKGLELEADREGVKYAIRAGYEPKALSNYLERLGKKQDKKMRDLSKTHPPLAERRAQLAQLLVSLKADEIIGATGEARFAKMHKRLK
jgi:predicted Zn-dependent protease